MVGGQPRDHPGRRRVLRTLLAIAFFVPAYLAIEALVVARLDREALADTPTRIYARPTMLFRGMRADRSITEEHLVRLGYRPASGRDVTSGEYSLGSRTWVIGRRPSHHLGSLASGSGAVVRLDSSGRIRRLEDEDGRRLSRMVLEPELIGRLPTSAREDRLPVRVEEVPDHLVAAVLEVEDRRFLEHRGLDFRRIAAAAIANVRGGGVVQGGSTITQQLAKNLFLGPERTLTRKLREAAMAVVLEWRYTKAELLEAYLNEIYLGQDGAFGLHGVGRAAEFYFGKDVGALDLGESALLAGMIRGPSLYSPVRNPERARARRDLVLDLMREDGLIDEEEARATQGLPLDLRPRQPPPRSTRYFLDYVAAPELRSGGERPLAVVTTLDLELQRAAERAVEVELARLEASHAWLAEKEPGNGPLQAALVALDPWTGEVLAMVGGRAYGESQFNRAVDARRQPGSAFKPVVALAALSPRDDGSPPFTLASTLDDGPFLVETRAGPWRPVNYDRQFRGTVTLREALERSLNVPFARLGVEVGPERIVATARALGIESPMTPYPSLALGAAEVSLLEITRAFGVLAAGGLLAESRTVLATVDHTEELASTGDVRGWRPFGAGEVYLVTSALRGAVERGTGQGIRSRGFQGDVAAKSGTTNGFRDGWFVGYTPNLAVGVWVGFDRGRSLELPGAGVALPIFTRFLTDALGGDGDGGPYGGGRFSPPDDVEVVEVDASTGLRGGWGCPGEPELFLRGTAPEERCSSSWASDRTLRRWVRRGKDLPRWILELLSRRND